MSRYYSFNDFMKDSVAEADRITTSRYGRSLQECYKVSPKTLQVVFRLLEEGWWVFTAVAALLALSMFGFLATLTAFLLTPVGLVVAAALGVAAASILKQLYRDRVLPMTIDEVGKTVKPRWDDADGNRTQVDRLYTETAEEIARRAMSWKVNLIR